MAAYYGLFRGLRSEYAPDTTHKDVVYFATDTQELLMNGTNYGGGSKPIELSKLDTLNNESACGTYKVVSGGNTLGTLIVNSNAGKTAIYQVLIGGVALSDGKIATNTSVLNDTIIMRSYVTASKVWVEWSEYLVNSINDLQTQTDANSDAIDTMQSQLSNKIDSASKGKPNGIASLDSEGKVLAEQLPEIGGNWESEKGQPNGLATLDNMGTLTEVQERFSEYDYYKNIAYAGKQGTGLIICKTNKGEIISRSVAGWNLASQLGNTLYTLRYIYALPTKPAANMSWMFGSTPPLRRVNLDGLDFSGTTSMTAFFPQSGGALFDIGKPLANSLKVSVSIACHPLLTPTCIANIIDWLYDFSVENDGSATLTLHKSVKARLSSKQIQTIVNKGWTLA